MENTNKIERSELWNQIYAIVKQIPRKDITEDAVDAPSATTSIEKLISSYIAKANRWDELNEQIGEFYEDEDSEGDLCDIGEITASMLGYL